MNWKPGLVGDNSGSGPTVDQFTRVTGVRGDRQFPIVAKDEAVASIKQGERAAEPWSEWVLDLLEAGRIVDRFAEGIGALELQAAREMLFQQQLQRIVI